MKKHVAIDVGILLCVFCCLAAISAQTPPASAPQVDRARIDAGKRLFADTCQNDHCHGGSARNMEDHSGFTPEHLRHVIIEGVPDAGMQAFKGVYTPEQVEQLVAYILSVSADPRASAARTAPQLAPAHSATTPGELSGDATAGRALFFAATDAQNCLDCHMFQGKGGTVGPDLTNAGGRPARELFRRIVMREQHSSTRMPTDEYASKYSLRQLLDLVAFLKSTDRNAAAGVTLNDLFGASGMAR
jgi:mono/diheme cytochrome c family protein